MKMSVEEMQARRRAIQLRSLLKKNTESIHSCLIDQDIHQFEILDQTQRLTLMKKARQKKTQENQEFWFKDVGSLSMNINNFIEAPSIGRDFVFSTTDFTRSPLVKIFIEDWDAIMGRISSVFNHNFRIYDVRNSDSFTVEYEKYKEEYFIDVDFWEGDTTVEDIRIETDLIANMK